jgi:hypothetical protein
MMKPNDHTQNSALFVGQLWCRPTNKPSTQQLQLGEASQNRIFGIWRMGLIKKLIAE